MSHRSAILKWLVSAMIASCEAIFVSSCIPTTTGKIVFASNRDGNYEIYVAQADGSGVPQRVTNNSNDDWTPVWSPDGSRIAYTRSFSPTSTSPEDVLMVIDANGTNEHQLTAGSTYSRTFFPVWSPDGTRLAFQAGYVLPTSAKFQVYVINADGTGLRQLASEGFYPHWSPDGNHITYSAPTAQQGTPPTSIYVVAANGTGQPQLLTTGGRDYESVYSPDGQHIAFVSSMAGSRVGLYQIHTDGNGLQQLASTSSIYFAPRWSGTGSQIAYVDDPGGAREIRLVDTTSLNNTQITAGWSPVWSPTYQSLAFTSDRDGDNEIYLVNKDGRALTQLTNNTYDDISPDWHR